MKISVTQHHIDIGFRGSCSRDPICLAMIDAGLSRPWASPTHIAFRLKYKDYSVETPDSVLEFMKMYDNGYLMYPFEFELEV